MSTTVDAAEHESPDADGKRDIDHGLWLLALLATLASILSRAIAPSLKGVWEGADHIIALATLAGAASSQMLAVGSSILVIVLVLTTLTSTLPQYLRAFSVGVGILLMLALSISAIDVTLPSKSRLVVAMAAALLVLVSARLSAQIYSLRAASLVVGLAACAGVARAGTVLMATHALEVSSATWGTAARVGATLHGLLDVAALCFAVAIVTTHPRGHRRLPRPRWPVLVLIVLIPVVFVIGVQLGTDPERGGIVVLLSNMAHHNRIMPAPFVPEMLGTYIEFLRWAVAAALLVVCPRSPAVGGALALALFSRGTLEVPLCAAALVVAALAVGVHPGLRADHAMADA